MPCRYFLPHAASGVGIPSSAPVSLWCRGYRDIPGFVCPHQEYCACGDVPDDFIPEQPDVLTLSPCEDDREYVHMTKLSGLKTVEIHHGQT